MVLLAGSGNPSQTQIAPKSFPVEKKRCVMVDKATVPGTPLR